MLWNIFAMTVLCFSRIRRLERSCEPAGKVYGRNTEDDVEDDFARNRTA